MPCSPEIIRFDSLFPKIKIWISSFHCSPHFIPLFPRSHVSQTPGRASTLGSIPIFVGIYRSMYLLVLSDSEKRIFQNCPFVMNTMLYESRLSRPRFSMYKLDQLGAKRTHRLPWVVIPYILVYGDVPLVLVWFSLLLQARRSHPLIASPYFKIKPIHAKFECSTCTTSLEILQQLFFLPSKHLALSVDH